MSHNDSSSTKKKHNFHQTTSYKAQPTKRRWVSIATLLISLFTAVVLSFVVYNNLDNISDRFAWSTANKEDAQENQFIVWEKVEVKGLLTDDGDLITYTHRLHTAEYGTLWVKSRGIDLSLYKWEVTIRGTIDKLQWDIYILEVDIIDGQKIKEEPVEDLLVANSGKYISQAGIYFAADFFDYYSIENETLDNITIKNKANNQLLILEYFQCKAWAWDKDCSKLKKTFASISEKTFDTLNGMTFYKLSEINSRYFDNQPHRGYFLNDAVENEVTLLWKYLKFPNKTLVDEVLKPNMTKICRQDNNKMEEVASYKLNKKGNKFVVSIKWTYFDGTVDCNIEFDPTLVLWWKLIDIDFQEELEDIMTGDILQNTGGVQDEEDEETADEEEDNGVDLDDLAYRTDENEDEPNYHDVEQFPINLDKALVFESGRWHKITFPAGNVTWRPATEVADKTLWGLDGVNCRSQTNVTKYNKENPDIAKTVSSIRIHECSIRWDFINTAKLRNITIEDGREFVIEVVDPARKEFADLVEIE